MKAALLIAPGTFELVERPLPPLGPNDVLVRVIRVGICGSDVHIYKGEYEREQLPRVLGHEFAGEVVELRTGTDCDVSIGDLVTADINIGCGKCTHCVSRNAVLCPEVSKIGIHRDGAFAEYIAVPAGQIIKLPGWITPAVGALVEPAGCVARSLTRCKLKQSDSLLVIGAGPMGMLHVQLAKAMGAGPIVVLETDPSRAETARRYGADAVAQDASSLTELASEIVGRGGFDVVAECVGKVKLYEDALTRVRPGGVISCFGLEQADRLANFSPYDLVLTEKTLVGSVGAVKEDMQNAICMLDSGRIETSPYTSNVFGIDDVDKAMKSFFIDKIGLKVQISPTGQ